MITILLLEPTYTQLPNGWVHEQNNNKATLDNKVIAKEIGLARYQRIENFDWSAGYTYWDETSDFWKKVREVWSEKIEKQKKIKVNSKKYNIYFVWISR